MRSRLEHSLATERARRGWSQTETAAAAGITRQSYAAIESGSAVPSTDVALRLARALGRSMEELFRLPEAPTEHAVARWAGSGEPAGRRVRLVRVAGQLTAYPADEGERPDRGAAGVVTGTDGKDVRITLLPDSPPPAALAVVGCDPAFGILVEALRRERGIDVAWSPRGSMAAIDAVATGMAHVAGAHLHDPVSGEVNGPWIRERISFPCTRIAFAVWEQGLLLGAGNPAGIAAMEDLARPEIRLVNREPGSGSRMLLDEELAAVGVPASAVAGYATAARGHLAVGEAIAAGLADAGVGIRAAGAAFGLELLPLRTEAYELIIPNHFLDLPAVQALLELLRRPAIHAQVAALQGYDTAAMGLPA